MTVDTASKYFPQRIPWYAIAVALGISIAAFALRAGVLVQRIAADPSIVPIAGTDHATFLSNAAGVLAGTFPDAAYYHQPGGTYFHVAIKLMVGDSLLLMYLVIALVEALSCGWFIGAGWLLTRRVWGGWLAGAVFALYPVAVFYGTTPLIAPQAVFWLSLLVFLVLWQRESLSWGRTFLLGIIGGIMALSRVNLLPVMGLCGVVLLLRPVAWTYRIGHVILLTVVTLLTISPITYTNYQFSGRFIFISTTGPQELYWANNRDSLGRNVNTVAVEQIDAAPVAALQRDIAIAPERFLGLMGYKFAMFWNRAEPGNNLDYGQAQAASSLLRLLPGNFMLLAALGILGIGWLAHHDRELALFFGAIIAWMCMTYMLAFVYSRLRHPVIVPLILSAAYAIVVMVEAVRRGTIWQRVRQAIPAAVVVGLLLGFSSWVVQVPPRLPVQRTYAQLPAQANRLDATFYDDSQAAIILRGWQPIDAWSAASEGWVQVFEAYGAELFWQLPQPTTREYNFTLRYIIGEDVIASLTRPIGAVSQPYRMTDQWSGERIHGDLISLRIDDEAHLQQTGRIEVAVWYWDDDGLIVNLMTETGSASVALQSLAIFNTLIPPDVPELEQTGLIFGERIALRRYTLPEAVAAGSPLRIPMVWEALTNIRDDYRLFVHITDADDTLITQADGAPVAALGTSNWVAGYPLATTITITAPPDAGQYTVYAGLYDETGRLSNTAPDNRYQLGRVTVHAPD